MDGRVRIMLHDLIPNGVGSSTINDVCGPTPKAVAGQGLFEARCTPEPVEVLPELRVWQSSFGRRVISTALLLTED